MVKPVELTACGPRVFVKGRAGLTLIRAAFRSLRSQHRYARLAGIKEIFVLDSNLIRFHNGFKLKSFGRY